MNPLIEIRNLKKCFRGSTVPSINGLSLTVKEGAIFGLLGPNGAGKTTTISTLCGICTADEGEISICGFSAKAEIDKIKPLIGVVPQEYALYHTLTAEENIKVFGGIYGLSSAEIKERAATLLSTFDLTSHKRKRVEHYSGGMKRRLNLIIALLHRPRILILDEPTVGIDVQSRLKIIENLKELNKQGMTMIYTSHHLAEAQELCTDIMLIDHGKCICHGETTTLLSENGANDLENLFILKTGKEVRD